MAKLSDICNNRYNLSPHQLLTFEFHNKNTKQLSELIIEKELDRNKGVDVGSENYLYQSPKYFLRTDILTQNQFTPCLDEEQIQPINPNSFVDMQLKKGDIILTKDSNIGECAILPCDLPNSMLCGAFYRLPLLKNKFYIFAILKSEIFRDQLDIMVPKGATIRHAGKKFLDCKIPFPKDETKIDIIEKIVDQIVTFEYQIDLQEREIYTILDNEINKSDIKKYNPVQVKYSTLISDERIDESFHDDFLYRFFYLVRNYPNGYTTLSQLGYKVKRGQNLQVSQIGTSIYYKENADNLYTLIKPTNFSNHGTIIEKDYIGNKNVLSTLTAGDIVFSAEGTIGKCVLFDTINKNCITNIHGIVLSGQNIKTSSFISSILRYYKHKGIFNYLSVGGQGGSLGPKLLLDIPIPKIENEIKNKISNLYYNEEESNGILQLDSQICVLKEKLRKMLIEIKNE